VTEASALARKHGLNVHLDGARLFNAAVAQAEALGSTPITEARRIARAFDSVSVCFSKGLGTPAGSALCGSKDFLYRAHRIRKMAGGGMRQVGILAGAAIHALDHHVDRLSEDHARARRLAAAFEAVEGAVLDPVHSNIVFVGLEGAAKAKADGFIPYLKDQGILALGLYKLRFVTHHDVTDADIDRTVAAIRAYFA
jgi:threonine aldolase